mgnify:CR=1 FL=1
MTKSALGTEKQRKINKKLLSRCMESGRGSCIEKTNVIPNKETDWEANKPNVSTFWETRRIYALYIYISGNISSSSKKQK